MHEPECTCSTCRADSCDTSFRLPAWRIREILDNYKQYEEVKEEEHALRT